MEVNQFNIYWKDPVNLFWGTRHFVKPSQSLNLTGSGFFFLFNSMLWNFNLVLPGGHSGKMSEAEVLYSDVKFTKGKKNVSGESWSIYLFLFP